MELRINGKAALVMGASQGLGLAIAGSLVGEGVNVLISSRNEKKLQDAARSIGTPHFLAADYTRAGSAAQLVERAVEKLGALDILVINTGGPPAGRFLDVKAEDWQVAYQNLWMSSVEAMQAALPLMQARNWGRILVVTSVAAKEPLPNLTISNGLRAGLLGLIKSISHEVASKGVTVNALLPGYTMTERLRQLGTDEAKLATQIPAGRVGRPEELGALAAFLASDLAGYVTGQAIACDGGFMKGY